MPYAAPEKPATWRDRLFQIITVVVIIGISALVVQGMIDHTRTQAYRNLQDDCDCPGCGS